MFALPLGLLLFGCQTDRAVPIEISARENLLVCNKGDHTVGIIDLVAGKQVATVDEAGVTGHELAISSDGRRAFVPIFGNSGVGKPGTDGSLIRVIDIEKRRIVGTIDFQRGVRPHCAVFGPKNGLLYVTTELENSVAVIDPITLQVLHQIPTDQAESHMLAIAKDGTRGYVSNVGPGTISVLDLVGNRLAGIVPLGTVCQRVALSADDKRVFTADQMQPRLAVISAESNAIERWVKLPGIAYGTAATPDGRFLVATLPRLSQVVLIDLETMQVLRPVTVPAAPQEVLISPDGNHAFVSCDSSGKVAVLDLKYWEVERLIKAGPGVDGLAWRN